MAGAIHAIDYLQSPQDYPPRPFCVVFGGETLLKRYAVERLREAILGTDEGDFSYRTFEGPTADWSEVMSELRTRAMFGGQRLVRVDEADDFVSQHRTELEDYAAAPSPGGSLLLCVGTWPSNTRLYKTLSTQGLQVNCGAPEGPQLLRWLSAWARQMHGIRLDGEAGELLVEMIGPELGLLDQELAKLAVATAQGQAVSAEMVRQMSGAWRAKTAWSMLDDALAGNTREAILQLDRLVLSGEHPVAILAQIAATLRRMAAATRLLLTAEASGRRMTLRDALAQAGVKGFVLEKTERQLRRLGRHRGGQLYSWLLKADLDLKGDSTLDPKLVLERLILQIAAPPS